MSLVRLLVCIAIFLPQCANADELDVVRQLVLTGRYEEAIEALSSEEPSEARALLMSRCHWEQGQRDHDGSPGANSHWG